MVDIVVEQMKKLSDDAQRLLKLAACSGTRFTMQTLQIISQMEAIPLAQNLCELEKAGLILATAHAAQLFLLAAQSSSPAAASSASASSSKCSSAPSSCKNAAASTSSTSSTAASSSSSSTCGDEASATPDPPMPATDPSDPTDPVDSRPARTSFSANSSPTAAATAAAGAASNASSADAGIGASAGTGTSPPDSVSLDRIQFRFVHDRVQAAAYRLIPHSALPDLHMSIAQHLLAAATPGALISPAGSGRSSRFVSRAASAVVSPSGSPSSPGGGAAAEIEIDPLNLSTHINRSVRMQIEDASRGISRVEECISENLDAKKVIELELAAGRQAQAAGAYAQALDFYRTGLLLLPHSVGLQSEPVSPAIFSATSLSIAPLECWQRNYDLCFQVHSALAESLFLNLAYADSNQFAAASAALARPGLHRAQLINQQIACHVQTHELVRAIDTGLDEMRSLGVAFVSTPSADLTDWIAQMVAGTLDVYAAPLMVDASYLAAMSIMLGISSALLTSSSPHMPTVVYSMADATRRFGVCPASAMAVVMLAKVLLTTNDIPAASSAAKYSLKLLERFADDSKNISAKVEYIALYHVAIRTLPPAVIANQIRDAHERSKDTGDIEWLCQSHTHMHTHARTHTYKTQVQK